MDSGKTGCRRGFPRPEIADVEIFNTIGGHRTGLSPVGGHRKKYFQDFLRSLAAVPGMFYISGRCSRGAGRQGSKIIMEVIMFSAAILRSASHGSDLTHSLTRYYQTG